QGDRRSKTSSGVPIGVILSNYRSLDALISIPKHESTNSCPKNAGRCPKNDGRSRLYLDRRFHLADAANRCSIGRHAECRCGRLDEAQGIWGVGGGFGVKQERDPPHSGSNLFEYFQPFTGKRILVGGEASSVAAGTR